MEGGERGLTGRMRDKGREEIGWGCTLEVVGGFALECASMYIIDAIYQAPAKQAR